uniref:Uncharacterized protein n=1 Tax=Oryza brachyantha TaxID=4533 RepID=J3L9V1_ORYBR
MDASFFSCRVYLFLHGSCGKGIWGKEKNASKVGVGLGFALPLDRHPPRRCMHRLAAHGHGLLAFLLGRVVDWCGSSR